MRTGWSLLILFICVSGIIIFAIISRHQPPANNHQISIITPKLQNKNPFAKTTCLQKEGVIAQIVRKFIVEGKKQPSDYIDLENQLREILISSPELVEELLAIFLSIYDEELLFSIAKVMREFIGEKEITLLIKQIQEGDDIHKVFSIIALSETPTNKVVKAVYQAYVNSESEQIKSASLYVLNKMVDILPEYIKNVVSQHSKIILLSPQYKDDLLNLSAIQILRHIEQDTTCLLNQIVFSQKSAYVKLFAVIYLGEGRLPPESIKNYLLTVAKSSDIPEGARNYLEIVAENYPEIPEDFIPPLNILEHEE